MYPLTSKAITVKVDEKVIDFVEEMVELGIVKSRNQALVKLITLGMERMKKEIERKKKIKELVEKFKREGIPYELPTAKDVEEGRE